MLGVWHTYTHTHHTAHTTTWDKIPWSLSNEGCLLVFGHIYIYVCVHACVHVYMHVCVCAFIINQTKVVSGYNDMETLAPHPPAPKLKTGVFSDKTWMKREICGIYIHIYIHMRSTLTWTYNRVDLGPGFIKNTGSMKKKKCDLKKKKRGVGGELSSGSSCEMETQTSTVKISAEQKLKGKTTQSYKRQAKNATSTIIMKETKQDWCCITRFFPCWKHWLEVLTWW